MTAHVSGGNDEREPETTAEELRRAARFIEAVSLDAVAELSQLAFPLAIGGLKEFPRPSPEDRAAREGVERLRRRLDDAAAELYALASAFDAGLTVPSVLLIPVLPYLATYREAAPQEQPYLIRAPNEGVDEDEFTPVDVDNDDQVAG